MDNKDIINFGINTFQIEIDAMKKAMNSLSESFAQAVNIILGCKGRVVVIGMGKSGIIGKKIAATLASTGTPAFFMHPAEGMHGDLGMLVKGDVVIGISNSGETDEMKVLLPLIKRLGSKLIAIVGKADSTLGRESDCILDASVEKEACPLNLAPTASTTVALAIGDALAVALVECRGFKAEDFAMFHPSGSLGKRLLTTVNDLMHTGDALPVVNENDTVENAVKEINEKKFGCTAVVNNDNKLTGIITDGDLRRAISKYSSIHQLKVSEIMTHTPKMIMKYELAAKALHIMEEYKISSLFIIDKEHHPEGIIHFQDLLKFGLV